MREQMTYIVENYVNGKMVASSTGRFGDIQNPATGKVIGKTPLSEASIGSIKAIFSYYKL
jgi:hypothetical protein